jgi:hypothetical protein
MQDPLTRLPKYEFKLTREQILFIWSALSPPCMLHEQHALAPEIEPPEIELSPLTKPMTPVVPRQPLIN